MTLNDFLELATELHDAMNELKELRAAKPAGDRAKAELQIMKAALSDDQESLWKNWQTAVSLLNRSVLLCRKNPSAAAVSKFADEVDKFLERSLGLPKILGDEPVTTAAD